jgi:hypothetical protein
MMNSKDNRAPLPTGGIADLSADIRTNDNFGVGRQAMTTT